MKNIGCIGCHQLGQLSTRTIPAAFGEFKSGREAWMRRVQSGQSGEQMTNQLAGQFGRSAVQVLRRVDRPHCQGRAAPRQAEPRRKGVERNIVVTTWEWGTEKQYLHDLIASDRRNPTVNAYGPLYGSPEYSTDYMPILDPKTNYGVVLQRCRCAMPRCRNRSARDMPPASSRCRLRPIGATRRSGTRGPTTTIDVRREGPGLACRRRARRGQPRVLQEGLRSPFSEDLPAGRSRPGRWRCSIRRR